ncbi:hypothetical protein G3I77_13715 [Streptomyces sp. D2-8]|uniref:hypothetical protein n=1 Tax=Streptomyces sp. D2-8 TaxID=2707767 RepID=UPI0020C05C0B|nr:hypothetical protein [Streptomyces sp. D2-8]MCK8434048.1 hypothetical protein [Streptomyces sp. D2-8]
MLVLILFGGGALFPASAAISSGEAGPMFGAAVCLGVGSMAYRTMRSRIHLTDASLILVNPIFSYEFPYSAIRKIETNPSGSLIIFPKEYTPKNEGEGYLAVGYAGSLLDRIFKTSERAARELKKAQKKGRRMEGADGPVRRRIAADAVAEFMVLAAGGCMLASVLLR